MAATAFIWAGKSKDGKSVKGEMTANSKEEVIGALRKQGVIASTVKSKGGMSMEIKIPGMGGGVTEKDLIVFTRQFATMIDAGLPLVQCLEILEQQTENKALAKTVGAVRADVEAGSTYADALSKHPKVFDELYVNLVAAGEVAGILDTILGRLTAYIEKNMKLKKQIKAAMVYPSVVMFVAVAVISVLMIFVIPMFVQMFADLGGELPGPTQFVVSVSAFMTSWKMLIVVGLLVAVVFTIKAINRTTKGRYAIDSLLLKMPIVGNLMRKVAVSKFTRTLGTLMGAGVPILDGLEIVAKTAGNKVVEKTILETRGAISEGKTLSEPLGKGGVFPPMVTQMISIGETTGALDAMLAKIADFYDDEVDNAVDALTAALEPALMVFLGTAVGFIIVAMYLPIFKMASVVG